MQVLGHEDPQDLVQITDPPEVQRICIVTHLVPGLHQYLSAGYSLTCPWYTCLGEWNRDEVEDWHSSPLERNVVILNARRYPCSILKKHIDLTKKIIMPSKLCPQMHLSLMDFDQPTLKIVFPETLLVDLLKFLSMDTSRSYQSPFINILECYPGLKIPLFWLRT